MNFRALVRTLATGGLLAAVLGCAAGGYLRPELEGVETGRTLIVSLPHAEAGAVAFEEAWAVEP